VLADRFLLFDEKTGLLRAEAGLSLAELFRLLLPRRWFAPVTPGTKFVTLGGAVAADVHGKNHHIDGSFGRHVTRVKLRVADGRIVVCSPDVEPALFFATIGGMGLTGHILEVEFRMTRIPSPWIYEEREPVKSIDAFPETLKRAAADWPFTVGWLDCLARGKSLGRGVLMKGRWAQPQEAPSYPPPLKRMLRVPFDLPSFALNRFTMTIGNSLYFHLQTRHRKPRIVDPHAFFYPLDRLHDWNRLYGRRGFTQYQCVIPNGSDDAALRKLMTVVAESGEATCLCVIKDCGAEGPGMLSFCKPGISIALDLPVRPTTEALVAQLNEIVLAEGGRIYLAKDALTRREHFVAMEPRLPAWNAIRRQWDPARRIRSAIGDRLLEEGPR
jgi:FAD/FMN-containing dehydrogenase